MTTLGLISFIAGVFLATLAATRIVTMSPRELFLLRISPALEAFSPAWWKYYRIFTIPTFIFGIGLVLMIIPFLLKF